jgi:hypothetical protein
VPSERYTIFYRDLRRLSVVYAAGTYQLRGRFCSLRLGSNDTVGFGTYQGTFQSRLARSVEPPSRLPCLQPMILWLVGFFIATALAPHGKLSWATSVFMALYLVLLPIYLVLSLLYNLLVHPKNYRRWEGKFLCLRCGAIVDPESKSGVAAVHRTPIPRPEFRLRKLSRRILSG